MADQIRAFPGLDYFKDDAVDRALFFGRDNEIKQLTARLIAEDLTVLFGKSGDGKTSLINAGLKPVLREAGYLPVRARVFNVVAPITPLTALYEAIAEEAKINEMTLPPNWQHETLWESFLALRPTPENGLKPLVLILDQFEELFTLMADRPQEQKDFVAQCADLVRGRLPETVREKYRAQLAKLMPDSDEARQLEQLLYGSPPPALRILLSLREDYLAFLNNLGRRIPKVFASRYRLASLTIEQARAAIANPPQQEVLQDQKFHIEEDAIAALLKFLTVPSSRSGMNEEIVGPPQLQVLCQQLEAQMRQREKNRISVADLGGENGMRQLLSNYYHGILEKFPAVRFGPGPRQLTGLLGILRGLLQPVHSPRFAVRCLCEERLITAGGNRNSRHEDEIIREIGVAPADLQQLVESRLLRREPRLQEAFYELSHDSLVPSLLTAGGLRQAWVTGLKVVMLALLVFIVINSGVPLVKSFFVIDTLKQEFESVKAGKIQPIYFRERLKNMRDFVRDTTSLAKLKEDFDEWRQSSLYRAFMQLPDDDKIHADSLIHLVQIEYPAEQLFKKVFLDTLYERNYREVKRAYQNLVKTNNGQRPAEIAINRADSLLNAAFWTLNKDTRILSLQGDLAKIRGDVTQQRQIALEVSRQNKIAEKVLFEAIQIEEPKSKFIQGDSSGGVSQFKIVLQYSPILESATVLLNGEEMSSGLGSDKMNKLQSVIQQKVPPARTEKFLAGMVEIPARVRDVKATITATNNAGIEATKEFTFTVDRMPPQLKTRKFLYKEAESDEWRTMPPNEWRGNFWRIEVQASESLQGAALNIQPRYSNSELSQVSSVGADNVPSTLANAGRDVTFSYTTSEKFKIADEVECTLVMQDLAGWQSSISLGKWKIIKMQTAQEIKPTGLPALLPLRSTPDENLTAEQVRNMIKKYNFYCKEYSWSKKWSNPNGRGITKDFIPQHDRQVILDRATGLMWERSGSPNYMTYADAEKYIEDLNLRKFGEFNDWRLPTLEEAMSLMEPKRSGRLYIDAKFDAKQWRIWTSDIYSAGVAWVADFDDGYCGNLVVANDLYVRAVRVGQ